MLFPLEYERAKNYQKLLQNYILMNFVPRRI